MVEMPPKIVDPMQGHRQIRNALLLTLAIQHGDQVATLDTRLAQLHPASGNGPVTLIPV